MNNGFNLPPKVNLSDNALMGIEKEKMIIDDFQIAYYETVGNSNFFLVEELAEGIDNESAYEAVKEHIALINSLINRKVRRQEAIQELFHSIKKLAADLFEK